MYVEKVLLWDLYLPTLLCISNFTYVFQSGNKFLPIVRGEEADVTRVKAARRRAESRAVEQKRVILSFGGRKK